MKFDYVIIGAGIIGLATAREILNRYSNAKVLVLEKEKMLGAHASGRNSGVLHTGIYYPADTLKAKFCKRGADMLFEFATENNIPVRKDGKVIVARSEENALGLEKLLRNAKENGINAVKLDRAGIVEIEPHANADFGGIYCKDTAVIDSNKALVNLRLMLESEGAEIAFNQEVISIDESKCEITTSNNKISYGFLINAAGAFADKVAKMVGIGENYKLIPFKGIYYKLTNEQAFRVKGSIYPVPDPELPFLGIHFTRVINGNVYVGPTAIPALGRENYGLVKGLKLSESLSILTHLSKLFLSDVQNFRNLVYKETPHFFKKGVLSSAAKLMNELNESWLEATPKIGIRPQLINTKEKCLEMDFLLEKGKNSLHVLNSISPAFTSSFAVADYIVDELKF